MGICINYTCNKNKESKDVNVSDDEINKEVELNRRLFEKKGRTYIKIKTMKKGTTIEGSSVPSSISTEFF